MFTPGAITSGFTRYVNGVGPRLEKPAMIFPLFVRISVGFAPSTVTVPSGFIAAPSTSETIAAGIVGWLSRPSLPIALGSPGELFTTSTPTAPAASAFRIFTLKKQVPRSISAIFPVRFVEIAVQPLAGVVVVYWTGPTAGVYALKSPVAAPKFPLLDATGIPM